PVTVDLPLGVLTKYPTSGVSRGPVAPRTFRDPPRTRKKICWQPFRPGFQTGEHEPQHREVASVVDIAHPADHGRARGPRGPAAVVAGRHPSRRCAPEIGRAHV